jgi:hypothetical protein
MKISTTICLSILALGALGTSLLPSISRAADMKEVACSAIDLKYDGEATTTKCMQVDDVGNQTEAQVQRIIVKTSTSEMIVTYYAGRFRTYFPLRPLHHMIEQGGYFADIDNWQAEHKFGGFDIAAFNGFGKAGDAPTLCAGFARYSGQPGNYEFDGGPGYKNLAEGIYCVFSGEAALINPVDNFYRVVEGVLGKMHLPQ